MVKQKRELNSNLIAITKKKKKKKKKKQQQQQKNIYLHVGPRVARTHFFYREGNFSFPKTISLPLRVKIVEFQSYAMLIRLNRLQSAYSINYEIESIARVNSYKIITNRFLFVPINLFFFYPYV